jgi:cell division protease FtsH
MTKLRRLAAAVRPLADVLVDTLRASARLSRLRTVLPDEDADDYLYQFSLDLDDDRDDREESGPVSILHPDEAAVAVLLGNAFEHSRDVLGRLLESDTVAVIEVPDPDFVEPVTRLLRKHVLGPEATVLDGDGLTKQTTVADTGTVVIFERTDEVKPRTAMAGGAEFAAAVQLRCAIIGITADANQLPPELVSLAGCRIVIPPLDGATVATVIEAVTGRLPAPIDEQLARRATLEALSIAVRADLGAEGSAARLRRLLATGIKNEDAGPLLSEMHGLGPAQQWGLDLAADLRAYIAGKLPWSACPKGLLLSGPPGTGKTSYARALSREVGGIHFIATSYAAWQSHKEGHLGDVTSAIRKIFAEAASHKPCSIVFIDEIDSLPSRDTGRDNSWWSAIVNTVLEQLDGFQTREGVVVIAACNDPAKLDGALVRAGRLDTHIAIPMPDVPALCGIFRTHLGADLAGADLRAAALAARGRTGADVERWVRMARRAARAASRAPALQDLLDAVRGGGCEWPADVRRRVAYHEAGHAVMLLALGIAEPTALSIGGAGGLAESDPGELQANTRAHLKKFLVALLGGRAAEELVFGEVTAGAGGAEDSDLGRATRLATRIETAYGFGSLGLICLPDGISHRDLLMFDQLRAAVGSAIDRAYATAVELLGFNRRALDALAEALFAAGYLDQAEIKAALARTPLRKEGVTDPPPLRLPEPEATRSEDNPAVAAPNATGLIES